VVDAGGNDITMAAADEAIKAGVRLHERQNSARGGSLVTLCRPGTGQERDLFDRNKALWASFCRGDSRRARST